MIPLVKMLKDTVQLIKDEEVVDIKCLVITQTSRLFQEREVIFHDFDLMLITLPEYKIGDSTYKIETGDLIKVDRLYRVIRVNSYIAPNNKILYNEVFLEVRS